MHAPSPVPHVEPPPFRSRAFTLLEVITALTIFGLVMVGVLAFFIQSLNTYSYDTGKLFVNRDIRTFTNEMTDNATYANYFLIFPSFTDRSSTNSTTGVTTDTSVNDGLSGDFLVLVYKDPADDTKVNRLVGYYRDPADPTDSASKGPVRTFDLAISPSSNASVWTLLPSASTMHTNTAVLELSVGLANHKLFYNFYDRSIMVKGQIYHSGSLTKAATNTYNFTVSPRG
ncbi:MAG TPA: prepilin-type N-terminal cleavage/methylation domain-containing protein [Rariglobus sp.]|jgi:prepilin-type N-terminal cleavage/methylation domain-containing protein|nr:prepilin-type N-terminal cleavage/methylation domain-containing protein [Rariglobus sp.]